MSKKNFQKSIELLNKAVADELLAIHQYMYFHFHCDDQGYDLLASLFKKTAIQEMGHVEVLSERILFLKGDVEMKIVGEVKKIHDPKEMLKCAADMEDESARTSDESDFNRCLAPLTSHLAALGAYSRYQKHDLRIQAPKKYLRIWYFKKKLILTSSILKWKI